MRKALLVLAVPAALSCSANTPPGPQKFAVTAGTPYQASSTEPRITNIRMLTNGGENAEAYFSGDETKLIFQRTRPPELPCDQMFTLDLRTGAEKLVSTGKGRTTCGYFYPSDDKIIYASTHHVSAQCPAPPDMRQGYVWALYEYDLFIADADGSGVRQITNEKGYDAEATISNDGRKIVFTSVRNGDLDIYTADADGGNVRQVTNEPGYDGGAFFSPDGSEIVYRGGHPTTDQELSDYRRLLSQGLVRPSKLDIFIMNADGSNKRRLTNNGAANFAPFFHPSGRQIIFSSNMHDPRGRNFDLYLINVDGTGLERVTTHEDFDGFPMFSRDGTRLVFGSNRGQAKRGETNIFIADWKSTP
jgi:Tol biopolymer transport system component